MIKVLFILGTRPEAIKLAPLFLEMKKGKVFKPKICLTGQHLSMLEGVMKLFKLKADFTLDLMARSSTMNDFVSGVQKEVSAIIAEYRPELIIVQGDTNSAFAGGLAGFYTGVKVAHIEAGLRSYNRHAPYPEEGNRKMLSCITDLHFAPTDEAAAHLADEKITQDVYVVGNTVIDSLIQTGIYLESKQDKFLNKYNFISPDKKLVLFTAHRRESLGEKYGDILFALNQICRENKDIEVIFPMHMNPKVRSAISRYFKEVPVNLHLIEPLEYADMVFLMTKSYLIISDSGGIQEEAAALGVPVLILRDVTERDEVVKLGVARLIGTNKEMIVQNANQLIRDPEQYNQMSHPVFPYGKGDSSERIMAILETLFK